MNFLTAVIDSLVNFVRRNPLMTILIVILAIAAPAAFRGIALFILYFIMGILFLVIIAILLFRWRIYKVRRQMEDQFGGGNFGSPFAGEPRKGREGEVKVYKTSGTPPKRVSGDVGDYVEFEETKDADSTQPKE